jgi:hypothetical protein
LSFEKRGERKYSNLLLFYFGVGGRRGEKGRECTPVKYI